MSSKALRQMYKEHHICIHCGQNDAMPGKVSCAECLAKDLERHTQAYENLSGETKAAYRFDAKRLEIGCMPMFLDCIADAISWNVWQMDGLKKTVPGTDIPCKIKDWKANKEILFKDVGEDD